MTFRVEQGSETLRMNPGVILGQLRRILKRQESEF